MERYKHLVEVYSSILFISIYEYVLYTSTPSTTHHTRLLKSSWHPIPLTILISHIRCHSCSSVITLHEIKPSDLLKNSLKSKLSSIGMRFQETYFLRIIPICFWPCVIECKIWRHHYYVISQLTKKHALLNTIYIMIIALFMCM